MLRTPQFDPRETLVTLPSEKIVENNFNLEPAAGVQSSPISVTTKPVKKGKKSRSKPRDENDQVCLVILLWLGCLIFETTVINYVHLKYRQINILYHPVIFCSKT